MDKKKVTELIQEVISNNVDSLEFGNDKHNAPLRKANSLLHDALSVRKGTKIHDILEKEMPLKGVEDFYGTAVYYRVPKSEFEKEEL